MIHYPALIDGEEGAYGVIFPDLPGVCAMGATVADALRNAAAALQDYALEAERDGEPLALPSVMQSITPPAGNRLVSVPLEPTGVGASESA